MVSQIELRWRTHGRITKASNDYLPDPRDADRVLHGLATYLGDALKAKVTVDEVGGFGANDRGARPLVAEGGRPRFSEFSLLPLAEKHQTEPGRVVGCGPGVPG